MMIAALPEFPARVYVDHGDGTLAATTRSGTRFSSKRAAIDVAPSEADAAAGVVAAAVGVTCPDAPVSRILLRWDATFPERSLFLGDHWERGYGDLQWRHLQPERVMPWYFACHDVATARTFMAGVRVQPAAMCFWTVDAAGVSLWLDLRNGGAACVPGDRRIAAATIVSMSARDQTPMAALTRFCRRMCPTPRLPAAPVCGNNNWYYAYGRDFDADAMRRDAAFLADVSAGHPNRPFCVVDAGWTPGGVCPGGPWSAGDPTRFPDMPGLAQDMKRLGVRPGIWMRPTALTTVDDPRRLRAGPAGAAEKPLDLTLPENAQLVHDDVARVRSWGYELIKHDFSTFDVFGRWGFEMGAELTSGDWHFNDRSSTNAEIILRHYRNLRGAAGDATVLLGCNTIGHLAAGLVEVQRAGDDTSGRTWERTRRMGVNTLAFRLPQHGTFFACDPDCAAHTSATPWEFDRQFLDLVARSGTPLFISVDPRTVTPEQRAAYRAAMQTALSGSDAGGCAPLDWLYSTTPRTWRLGDRTVTYQWEEATGAQPFRV
jgi:alpha-galactosidase